MVVVNPILDLARALEAGDAGAWQRFKAAHPQEAGVLHIREAYRPKKGENSATAQELLLVGVGFSEVLVASARGARPPAWMVRAVEMANQG